MKEVGAPAQAAERSSWAQAASLSLQGSSPRPEASCSSCAESASWPTELSTSCARCSSHTATCGLPQFHSVCSQYNTLLLALDAGGHDYLLSVLHKSRDASM